MANHVGSLVRAKDDATGKLFFTGVLTLEAVNGKTFLVPAEKRGERSPDYKVKVRRPDGRYHEYGSAWLGKMKGDDGAQYVSITLSAPSMPAPIYVKAFPKDMQPDGVDGDGVGEVFDVVWNPSRPASYVPSARTGRAPMDDEIPF